MLFKSKLGPIKVLEAGDIHRIKGTKIECRKVLDREAMRQQMPEMHSNTQQAKAQLASPPQHPQTTTNNLDQWNYMKSNRTSALDTTINTEAGYQNNITPLKRSLRNTGQTFEMPGNHAPRSDDSFLSTQTNGWNVPRNDSFFAQQDWTKQQAPMQEVLPIPDLISPTPAKVLPAQPTTNAMLSFLDEEDEDDPWPQDSRQRLTLMPRQTEDSEDDCFAISEQQSGKKDNDDSQSETPKADDDIAGMMQKMNIFPSDQGPG